MNAKEAIKELRELHASGRIMMRDSMAYNLFRTHLLTIQDELDRLNDAERRLTVLEDAGVVEGAGLPRRKQDASTR